MTSRATPDSECKGDPDMDACDWLFDAGDPSTGINMAWACQVCGAVDVDRDPPRFDDDVI